MVSPDCDKSNRYATSHDDFKARIIALSGTAPLSDVDDPSQMSNIEATGFSSQGSSDRVRHKSELSVELSTVANRFRDQDAVRALALARALALRAPTWKLGGQHIAQACARYCRIAHRARNDALRNTRRTTWPSRVSALRGQPQRKTAANW